MNAKRPTEPVAKAINEMAVALRRAFDEIAAAHQRAVKKINAAFRNSQA